uniref:Uncharacterized protein n=1 Tax=Triticum urartu TaxID=4572 RepID=A0A8R7RGZ2_TRIUA
RYRFYFISHIRRESLAGPGEVEVATPREERQPEEPEPLLLHVELQHHVLHLEPSDDHRRRAAVPGLHPLHLRERKARRAPLHIHHREQAVHRVVHPALERQTDARHPVPCPRVGERPRVVAQLERRHGLHRARHGAALRTLLHQGLGERVHERAVHVASEQGEVHLSAEYHAAGGERARRDGHAGALHGYGLHRDVVRGVALLGDQRRVDQLLCVVHPRLRGELERAAAEDGHAVAFAEAGEAEKELIGDLLRGRHERRQRQAGAREPGHARGAPRQGRQQRLRRARRHCPHAHLAHRVTPVGGVGHEPGTVEAPGGAHAGDRVVRVRRARAVLAPVLLAAWLVAARDGVGVGEAAGGERAGELGRQMAGLARGPDERAGDVDDEVGAAVEWERVEGGGGVLGHRNKHRQRLARRRPGQRGCQDEEGY